MGWEMNFDSPVTIYRVSPDGFTSEWKDVHSKREYDAWIEKKQGWTHICPAVEYPRWLYNSSGETRSVANPSEEQAAGLQGFGRKVVGVKAAKAEPDDAPAASEASVFDEELRPPAPRRRRPRGRPRRHAGAKSPEPASVSA